ncbi:uncharacterized protein K452DRAFT_308192 [Aplosporella prunicola CBS 121167]|uniref:Uncharacterized protein n=1 Tax=Aplosporella prunicola CBS 121167 TaxID=1176127 RepID=A0A6A6BG35_9PEZI|nr:uncharacterized protein K452DRAFT_308192 [Aplosporella prunicola CBS 121167]KAF2142538.1 hypothetical protein K452DRAFT_308192 [Aplosporella prunicola CBS 121167]
MLLALRLEIYVCNQPSSSPDNFPLDSHEQSTKTPHFYNRYINPFRIFYSRIKQMFSFICGTLLAVKDVVSSTIRNSSNNAFQQSLPGAWPTDCHATPTPDLHKNRNTNNRHEMRSEHHARKILEARARRRRERRTKKADYASRTYVGPSQCAQAIDLAMENFRRGMDAAAFLAGRDAIKWPMLIQTYVNNNRDDYNTGPVFKEALNTIRDGAERAVHHMVDVCGEASRSLGEVQKDLHPLCLQLDSLEQMYDDRVREELAKAEEKWYKERNSIKDVCWENFLVDQRALNLYGMPEHVRHAESQRYLQEEYKQREEDLKMQLREQCRLYEAMLAADRKEVRENMEAAVEKAREEGYTHGIREKRKVEEEAHPSAPHARKRRRYQ